MEKYLVTSALPYANGPIHFGHIAGAYLPADVFVRFKRLTGADVLYICGTDEHGIAITISAKKEGNTPQQHVDKYHNIIKEIFKKFDIQFDNFSRTTLPHHYELSQKFFLDLYKNGYIEKVDTKQLYCQYCKIFLADRYVYGECYYCGSRDARGDECQKCGKWLDPLKLKNPRCSICGNPPIIKDTFHYFLLLNKFSNRLKEWIKSKNWKPNVKNFVMKMIEEGLDKRPISRDMTWGVPLPLEEAKGKVLYVWFDAPIGYISSTIHWAQKKGDPDLWKNYWFDKNCKLIHFIGKDNIPFHCIVWPAMLMGQDSPFILPEDVPANEFYNLEGRQFSKSTGWYIDLEDFFSKYSVDSIRYTIAANMPETKDSDFVWKDFQKKNNSELADILGNFVNRTLKFIQNNFERKIPYVEKGVFYTKVKEFLMSKIELIKELYNTYQVRRVCFEIMEIARFGNKFFDENSPWKKIKESSRDTKECLYACANIIKVLSIISYPIIPNTAVRMGEMIGLEYPKDFTWNNLYIPLEGGRLIGKITVLFKKIDDAQIKVEEEKLYSMTKKKDEERQTEEEYISYEEFSRIKLKVAKIVEAEEIKGSKKLVKLKVIADRPRQIIAGIKQHYRCEELIGKNIIIVSNLKPAKLMGHISEGMLLAASNKEELVLICPEKEISVGSKVS